MNILIYYTHTIYITRAIFLKLPRYYNIICVSYIFIMLETVDLDSASEKKVNI